MLLFMDGCAHYDTARIGYKYTTVNTTDCTFTVAADGRFGNALKRVSTGTVVDPGYVSIAPRTTRLGAWTPTTGGVVGCAIKVDDLSRINVSGGLGNANGLISVLEGSEHHLALFLNPDGTFTLRGNATSTGEIVLAVSSGGLTSGAWAFVEMKWLISATVGTCEVRVNGTAVLTFAGNTREQDTFVTSLGVWNAVRLLPVAYGGLGSPLTLRLCDLYLADLDTATAADVSDFLGDGIIETIRPNGVGSATGWTPNTGTNWAATDDLTPDDDTTYVATTAPATLDTYQFEDIPVNAVVKGAHMCMLARKEDEGSASVAPVVHQGSTDYVGPTQGVPSTSYDRYLTQAYDLNPATSAKFTAAEINGGQFGVKKIV